MIATQIQQYGLSLELVQGHIESDEISVKEVIELFKIRDAIQNKLLQLQDNDSETLESLVNLDRKLETLGPRLANTIDLKLLEKTFAPEENNWWWRFERREKKKTFNFIDMAWNGLAAAVLAITASYVVLMVQAFSTNGMGLEEIFSTILQGAGLAVLGKGTLTTNGRKQFHTVLNRFNVKQAYHSFAFFCFTALLFGIISVSYHRLDTFFYNQGLKYYNNGQLTEAASSFHHALVLEPKNSQINTALGLVHESLGDMNKAVAEYKIAVEEGLPEGFNDLGHALIQNNNIGEAETYLRMGLQRVYSNYGEKTEKQDLKYKLHRNLGWALLKQNRYEEAYKEFDIAVALDSAIPEEQIGGGLAYCLYAYTLDKMNNSEKAEIHWSNCKEHARPETIGEYSWLMGVRPGNFTNCIDTNSIVVGIDLRHPAKELEICSSPNSKQK